MPNLTQVYHSLVKKGRLIDSEVQSKVVSQMNSEGYPSSGRSFFHSARSAGIYLYGDVGRGKSFLMGMYFRQFHGRKHKMHFHEFTSRIRGCFADKPEDGIGSFLDSLDPKLQLFYLDELHATDISDAMLLAKFLVVMFKRNIFFVTTSNYHPDSLYKGANYDSFSPTVALIKEKMKIINIDGDVDYRGIDDQPLRFIGKDSDMKLESLFLKEIGQDSISELMLDLGGGRKFKVKRCVGEVAWFVYDEFMQENLGASDYRLIAECFKLIFISSITGFSGNNELLRFIIMIDQFYESKAKLFISVLSDLSELGSGKGFKRALSRIKSMNKDKFF